jgi:hypothetical protein
VVPLKKSESYRKIEAQRNKAPAERNVMRLVVRMVREEPFVHCYLACGHMLTIHSDELKEPFPSSIECWACEEQSR